MLISSEPFKLKFDLFVLLINCNGMLVTPGFVDPHTHPVFLNGREDEFEMRLNGKNCTLYLCSCTL